MQETSKASNGLQVAPLRQADGEPAAEECTIALNADSLHDLVGPVNQMRAMADLILKKNGAGMDEETEALFGFLRAASDKVENLLSGMRTYMRLIGQAMPPRVFDGNAALAGGLATIQDSIDRSEARVTSDRLPELCGDPNQISYLLASLVENSIKFRGECRPEIHIAARETENGWLLSVCDNGMGIDPKYRERIFGVFQRIQRDAYPGAGMGLAIARRIVEKHGGRIWVESQLGQGATFFIALPGVEASSPASEGS
jgi:light-regulated signal transduction histidine kinase (bacteriophytochrome)